MVITVTITPKDKSLKDLKIRLTTRINEELSFEEVQKRVCKIMDRLEGNAMMLKFGLDKIAEAKAGWYRG